ncbi:AI-2E family transporter [Paenibacillus endoradicis]|uniref:AI-2E family transporter n=1 Tax=Paenibacillus endoradicis TaxID=2972487 RepID=UPI002159526E|nr:AI-2E family transporter [Paenibacillus endoradicis]MCR8656503.1 AI-2E family transporter [Paenibacillus endoradicis]
MLKINHFIKLCIAVFMILAIVYVGTLVDFVFKPILSLVTNITIPLMLSVFFYYLLLPLVNWMEKKKINRAIAILLIYLFIAILLIGFFIVIWPTFRTQMLNLFNNAPNLLNALNEQLKEIEESGFLSDFFPADVSPLTQITNYVNKGFMILTNYITSLFSVISNVAIVLFIFPVILFYMLKESGGFSKKLVKFTPKRFHEEATEVVTDINQSLSNFIVSRVLINLALGVLMYIGFLIIDLPYALLLTAVAVIMNFIPFIGAILSAIPIIIIGFIESPSTAIWSLVIILVAQQIQDNLIAPYILGKQLDIHPITTIIIVLIGGDLAGILGMLLIIPVYMTIKIIVIKVYELFIKQKWENA